MKADRLEYEGFRNLKAGEFRPSEGVNIVYGDNGQGKTNLLEALWLFTGGRSFRGARDGEMKGFAADKAALRLEFTAEDRAQEAAITIQKRRAASIGGIPQPSPSRLAGRFCAVVFSPAHLSLIKDGPEERRRFLDAAYCQLRPGYIASLSEYSRTLAQRNALLKNARQTGARPGELLDVWDDRLARIGARLLLARRAYVRKIQPVAAAIYDGLSAGRESFSIAMHDDGGEDGMDSGQAAARLLERLRETRHADLAAGFTTAGPHRADLLVQIRGLVRPVLRFPRTAALRCAGPQAGRGVGAAGGDGGTARRPARRRDERTGFVPAGLYTQPHSRLAGVHHLLRSGRGAAAGRRPGLPDAGRNPDAGRVVPF